MIMRYPNIEETLPNDVSFEMTFVEGGSFLMGGRDDRAAEYEKPVHEVSLPSFYIGKYPVTQEVWTAVMGAENNPSGFPGYKRPVERVSWNDTQDFIKKLNELTGRTYRLLTEAEWEYAARGGKLSQGYIYAGSNKLTDIGWFKENSAEKTHPVGLKYSNELGLYDMSGNVREWVEDQWHDNYEGAPVDGSAWVDGGEGAQRVRRGGSWLVNAQYCRVAYRYRYYPTFRYHYLGFRLGLSPQSDE